MVLVARYTIPSTALRAGETPIILLGFFSYESVDFIGFHCETTEKALVARHATEIDRRRIPCDTQSLFSLQSGHRADFRYETIEKVLKARHAIEISRRRIPCDTPKLIDRA